MSAEQPHMEDDEPEPSQEMKLRNRVSRLEDQIQHVYEPRLEEQRTIIAEQSETIDELAEQLESLRERVVRESPTESSEAGRDV